MRLTKLGLIIASGIGLFTLTNQRVNAKTSLDTNSDYYMPAVFPNHHLTYNMQNMNKKDQYVYKIAFKNWQEALNNQITFSQNSNKYQVKLFSAKNGNSNKQGNGLVIYTLAITYLFSINKIADSANIYMYDKTITKVGENTYKYRLAIAEHEIGHLIGLGEFDHVHNDVMGRYAELGNKNRITSLDIREAIKENNLEDENSGNN